MLGHTQIVIAYSVRFLKVEYVLVKSLIESGSSRPLSYLVMDGAGNNWKTGVDVMSELMKSVQFSVEM